ncbi:hypothetical protein POM88_020918 [Heracleum sosnowskyi]|uniref:Uncharacterized protein n=1 Tax=Heracleum sosnowskyi TaxID=360622 RepID=A0AAD8IDJ0_9APIA|nr:hypothetical protein POM88_020918 [Heracleum sosnowskyi]
MKAKDRNMRPCMTVTPIRALSKVRDFYVQSMNNLANGVSNGYGPKKSLPKSFRINSSLSIRNNEEDFLELLRVASTEILSRHTVEDQHEIVQRQQPETTPEAAKVVPRSLRLTIGRIDEDSVCDFADDNLSIKDSAHMHVSQKQKLGVFFMSETVAYK